MLRQDLFSCIKSLEDLQFIKDFRDLHKHFSFNDIENEQVNRNSIYVDDSIEKNYNFLGALLLNDKAGSESLPDFPLKKDNILKNNEFKLYSQGYSLFMSIYRQCIQPSLSSFPMCIQVALSPYANYKINNKITGSFHNEEAEKQVSGYFEKSFLELPAVQLLKNFLTEPFTQKLTFPAVMGMLSNLNKELSGTRIVTVPESMRGATSLSPNSSLNESDKILRMFIILYSIKKSLDYFYATLFSAIVGNDLAVIDENSIINVKTSGSLLGNIRSFKLTEAGISAASNVGTLVLMDFGINQISEHYHDFGIPVKTNISFTGELGSSSTVEVCILDDDLNPFEKFISLLS